MHALVLREEVYRTNRWVANNIYKACEKAKSLALARARFSGSLQFMLPWLAEHLEKVDRVFREIPGATASNGTARRLTPSDSTCSKTGFSRRQ